MANMNIVSPTAAKVFAAWQRRGLAEAPRNYLGASIIGHECEMYLWLMFRNAVHESFDGRLYRLFDRGKREEAVFCSDLRSIGIEVKEFDESGNQFGVSDFGGHFGGHLDGVARGFDEAPKKWHVVEFKTHSDSSFRKLCKEGVKKAKPMHYAQMQTYMGYTGLDCAMYMAVDKDNDDLWVERIKFDSAFFDGVKEKAKRIISTSTPDRCANRQDDFRCKACPCHSVCWHASGTFIEPSVQLTCKTCCHSTAVIEGDGAKWTCALGHECNSGVCPDHLILPSFVNGELKEGDAHGLLYSFEADGKTNEVTIGSSGMSEEDAKKVGPATYGAFANVKENFPNAKIVETNTLAAKYSKPGHLEMFSGTVEQLNKFVQDNAFDFSNPVMTEDIGGVKYFEYYPNTLVTIDGNMAKVITDEPPF